MNVLAEGKSENGKSFVRVCEFCLKDGDLDAKLKKHAERIRRCAQEEADFLEGLIGRLDVPTFSDWAEAEQRAAEAEERASEAGQRREARQIRREKPDPAARPSDFEVMAFDYAIRALDPAKARERVREMRAWHGDGYVDALLEGINPTLREKDALYSA